MGCIVLGVDPGHSGALAVIRDGTVTDLLDMPVAPVKVGKTVKNRIPPSALALAIRDLLPLDVAYVEEVSAMPNQGVSSTFIFGQGHGMILGACAALHVPIVRIRPPQWRKVAGVRGTKDGSRTRAMELYPNRTADLSRKKDDGRAEAILLAHVGGILHNA